MKAVIEWICQSIKLKLRAWNKNKARVIVMRKRRTWAGVRGSQQICPPKGETALKDADGSQCCADGCSMWRRASIGPKRRTENISIGTVSYLSCIVQVEEWRSVSVCCVYIFNVHILCIKQHGCKGSHQSV